MTAKERALKAWQRSRHHTSELTPWERAGYIIGCKDNLVLEISGRERDVKRLTKELDILRAIQREDSPP
jgi:hypothetical protein